MKSMLKLQQERFLPLTGVPQNIIRENMNKKIAEIKEDLQRMRDLEDFEILTHELPPQTKRRSARVWREPVYVQRQAKKGDIIRITNDISNLYKTGATGVVVKAELGGLI